MHMNDQRDRGTTCRNVTTSGVLKLADVLAIFVVGVQLDTGPNAKNKTSSD
jgi:hypothetical protein